MTVLFIGVGFHDFDKLVVDSLKKKYDVVYINSMDFEMRHKVLFFIFNFLGLNELFKRIVADSICKEICKIEKKSIEKLFVIKGTYLDANILNKVKHQFNIKDSVLYLWDSWCNHDNLNEIHSCFSRIYTFDSKDSIERQLYLRPLFCCNESVRKNDNKESLDISFIGVDHSNRYEILNKFVKLSSNNALNYKFILLIGRVQYYLTKYFPQGSRYNKNDMRIFASTSVPYNQYLNIIESSRVVLDIPDNNQTGLTMRTIEALAMGKRIITTNQYIQYYNDIPKDMYLIIEDSFNEDVVLNFIKTENNKASRLPDRYYITSALAEMIG